MPIASFQGLGRISLSAVMLAPLLLAGCGSSIAPVTGKVTVNDKALTSGTVTLVPDKTNGNKSAALSVGEIGEDGTYEIKTDGKPGAPVGAYKVLVVSQGPPLNPKDMYSKRPMLVNLRYTQEESTTLNVKVVSNPAPGAYDLKLSP